MGSVRQTGLSGADSAWWGMERPDNQMVITAVLTFQEPLSFPRVEELIATRLLRFRRFRQRLEAPAWPLGRVRWVDDGSFELSEHLHAVTLRPPADREAMQELVSELMSVPLDADKPLWQLHFVEQYRGGCALVARIHHSIGDGIALIRLLLTLDDTPGNESATATWWERSHRRRQEEANGRRGWGRALTPLRKLGAGIRAAGLVTASVGHLVLMPFDRRSALQGPLVVRKSAAWSEPFPLEEVRRIGRAASATVHDVLAACAAGAIREYLLARGQDPDDRRIRAAVPVSLRAAADPEPLGNQFGLVFLPLPIQYADPLDRLRAVQASMTRAKGSAEPLVVFGLLTVFGQALRPGLPLMLSFLGRKASLVMTNVPGPRDPVTFLGSRLTELMAWVPQAGRLGVGVTLLSYAGKLQVGVAADTNIVPDPEEIVRACERALRELQARLLPTGIGAS